MGLWCCFGSTSKKAPASKTRAPRGYSELHYEVELPRSDRKGNNTVKITVRQPLSKGKSKEEIREQPKKKKRRMPSVSDINASPYQDHLLWPELASTVITNNNPMQQRPTSQAQLRELTALELAAEAHNFKSPAKSTRSTQRIASTAKPQSYASRHERSNDKQVVEHVRRVKEHESSASITAAKSFAKFLKTTKPLKTNRGVSKPNNRAKSGAVKRYEDQRNDSIDNLFGASDSTDKPKNQPSSKISGFEYPSNLRNVRKKKRDFSFLGDTIGRYSRTLLKGGKPGMTDFVDGGYSQGDADPSGKHSKFSFSSDSLDGFK